MEAVAPAVIHKRLGQISVEAGLLSEDDVAADGGGCSRGGVRLGKYIVDKGLVTAEALPLTLSTQLGLRFLAHPGTERGHQARP